MTDQADRPFRVVGLVMSALLLLAGCGGKEIVPPTPPGDVSDARAAGGTAVVQRLAAGLKDHDRDAVLAVAAPDAGSRAAVTALYDNAQTLGLTDIALRYVILTVSTPPTRVAERYGTRAWAATVEVTWTLPTYDAGPVSVSSAFVFETTGTTTRLAAVGGGSERSALWLTGPLQVDKTADTLVMVAGTGDAATYAPLARKAVSDVHRVLGWDGPLVVEVPTSEEDLERLLGVDKGSYAAIAAVTTSVDGSSDAGSPVHVFINPAVFTGLGARGSQVVLSHEATHVATKATFAAMPTWLLEGFADFVALAHAGIPVSTAAAQIIAEVRSEGAPDHLPTTDDLAPQAESLGATYEEAWTVCRFMGQQYGEAKVVAFYDAVDHGATTQQAFGSVLGTTQAAFVKAWSADLVQLAGGAGGA
ncbi:MAG: hypothetical protein JWO46_630 [Nocardioidaceae bacterium]|nr:hypothetical protein [Nocardioidaceae bacterium]